MTRVTCYGESLRLGRRVDDPALVAESLEGLGAVALAQDHPAHAARLLGAAAAQPGSRSAPQAPLDRATYDRAVAAARAALPEDAFNTSWAAGAALSPEQAISDLLP